MRLLVSLKNNVDITRDAMRDLGMVLGFVVGAILLGALTLRRRVK